MEQSQALAPLGSPRLASYGEEQEGRGAGSSSRYGETLGKPWLALISPGRARGGGEIVFGTCHHRWGQR